MTGSVLFDLLVVLVAAKVAAELAARVGAPTVVGEIAAGICIGPSVLHLVHPSETLTVLGELGVILLLVQVGQEMDLGQLRQVGGSALGVAVAGVIGPLVVGTAASLAMGHPLGVAVFIGGALTATSVGIAARAFGDLGALGRPEARVVVGAAVGDDVLGLMVLTIVTRAVTGGGVNALGIASVTAIALAFLVLAIGLGLTVIAPAIDRLSIVARSTGTVVAGAFALALAMSAAAEAAHLAPIIGAFLAGLALRRTRVEATIARELTPVGHILIPVFFLRIGIDTDLAVLARPRVLGIAAVLTVVAIGTKVAAGWAAGRRAGDPLLIGLAMVPRGEVGLVFATLGMRTHVLGEDLHGALVLVILITTLITPSLLRRRLDTLRSSDQPQSTAPPPDGGWLRVLPATGNENGAHGAPGTEEVGLLGRPSEADSLSVALRAAMLASEARPSAGLVEWASNSRIEPVWDTDSTRCLIELLRSADPIGWRFLEVTGVLSRALPELAEALDRRRNDQTVLDPLGIHRLEVTEALHALATGEAGSRIRLDHLQLEHPDRLALAALAIDIADPELTPADAARALASRLRLAPEAAADVIAMCESADLLRNAVTRPEPIDGGMACELASALRRIEVARGAYLLALASGRVEGSAPDGWQEQRLTHMHTEVQRVLQEVGEDDPLAARRDAAIDATADTLVAGRLVEAPDTLLIAFEGHEAARLAAMLEPRLPRHRLVRTDVSPLTGSPGRTHRIVVVARDRSGLLARVARVLTSLGTDIVSAGAATWPDGAALEWFDVFAPNPPEPDDLTEAVESELSHPTPITMRGGLESHFEHAASPWHTVCLVTGLDAPGRLAEICEVFARLRVRVHTATVATDGEQVCNRFSITDLRSRKLNPATCAQLAAVFADPDTRPPRPVRRWPRRSFTNA